MRPHAPTWNFKAFLEIYGCRAGFRSFLCLCLSLSLFLFRLPSYSRHGWLSVKAVPSTVWLWIDIFKTSIAFSGAFLWNNLHLTVTSCHSHNFFKWKPRVHLEVVTQMDCDQNKLPVRERRKGFRAIAVAVTGHSRPNFYTSSILPSPPDCLCECPPPLLFNLQFSS